MAKINKLALVTSIAMSAWKFHGKATSPDSPGGQDITPEEFVDFMIAMSAWKFHGKATSPDSPGGQDITPEEFVDFMKAILNRILQEHGITDKTLVLNLADTDGYDDYA